MVDSDGGYGCFASIRSLKHRERVKLPSGALDISEASVIPEMREREVRKGKEEYEEALKKKSPRTRGKAQRQNRTYEDRT